jgi:hypothetical protein
MQTMKKQTQYYFKYILTAFFLFLSILGFSRTANFSPSVKFFIPAKVSAVTIESYDDNYANDCSTARLKSANSVISVENSTRLNSTTSNTMVMKLDSITMPAPKTMCFLNREYQLAIQIESLVAINASSSINVHNNHFSLRFMVPKVTLKSDNLKNKTIQQIKQSMFLEEI